MVLGIGRDKRETKLRLKLIDIDRNARTTVVGILYNAGRVKATRKNLHFNEILFLPLKIHGFHLGKFLEFIFKFYMFLTKLFFIFSHECIYN